MRQSCSYVHKLFANQTKCYKNVTKCGLHLFDAKVSISYIARWPWYGDDETWQRTKNEL